MSEKKESSLLLPIQDRPAERLHWLGSSFGITGSLHKFWKRQKFQVCYVRQTVNDITGEHSAIVIRELSSRGLEDAPEVGWLQAYCRDYRKRLLSMLSYTFRNMDISLALSLIDPGKEFASSQAHAVEGGAAEAVTFRQIYGSSPLSSSELLSAHLWLLPLVLLLTKLLVAQAIKVLVAATGISSSVWAMLTTLEPTIN